MFHFSCCTVWVVWLLTGDYLLGCVLVPYAFAWVRGWNGLGLFVVNFDCAR